MSFWMASSSAGVARLAASACRTSCAAESVERLGEQILDELALGLRLGTARPVEMRPAPVFAADQSLFGHDLQELEDRRVLRAAEHFVDVAHGARAALPDDAQDGELPFGRFWRLHGARILLRTGS